MRALWLVNELWVIITINPRKNRASSELLYKRFMSVMMLKTKCKLNNTELFLKLFHIQCKEIGNKKYYEETTECEKWQSEISP